MAAARAPVCGATTDVLASHRLGRLDTLLTQDLGELLGADTFTVQRLVIHVLVPRKVGTWDGADPPRPRAASQFLSLPRLAAISMISRRMNSSTQAFSRPGSSWLMKFTTAVLPEYSLPRSMPLVISPKNHRPR